MIQSSLFERWCECFPFLLTCLFSWVYWEPSSFSHDKATSWENHFCKSPGQRRVEGVDLGPIIGGPGAGSGGLRKGYWGPLEVAKVPVKTLHSSWKKSWYVFQLNLDFWMVKWYSLILFHWKLKICRIFQLGNLLYWSNYIAFERLQINDHKILHPSSLVSMKLNKYYFIGNYNQIAFMSLCG